jgi:outer membrane biosynthesis protein TonB
MDKNNNSYFYLGGLYATLMLFFVFAFFAYSIYSSNKISTFALKKDNAINVSIVMDSPSKSLEKKEQKESTQLVQQEEVIQNEKIVQKEPLPTEVKSKQENISTLFSKVSTKPVENKKSESAPQFDQKQLAVLNKKIEVSKQNSVSSMKQMVDNTKFAKATVKVTSQSASTGQEVNKYLARIQGQIYDSFYPPLNTQGQNAKVLLRLDADGHVLDFKIISYSGSDIFDAEVDRLKKRISSQMFPKNPNGSSGNYIITLVARE